MLFNSYLFWFFFFCVFTLYWLVPKKLQNTVLLISSYAFYSFWDWKFLGLIIISTLTDFILAKKIIVSPKNKKTYLYISLIVNLGILAIFKYFGFFIEQINHLLHLIGINSFSNILHFVLPIGISFYTFQTISYTVDVYRGITKPINNILDFALYVSFFPQLVAGPIERSYKLLPQLTKVKNFKNINFTEGFYFILYGLFMKIVLADNMAIVSNGIYNQNIESLMGVDIIVGTYAFAFQIYGDFSGYSLIAIGVSKLFGIDLMRNFKVPYISTNPSEFWRRWHISLSSWLKDYLYIPLGGNKAGVKITFKNLLITMLLGGLWHGANWTFIFWGLFHGLILIAYKAYDYKFKAKLLVRRNPIYQVLQTFFFFHLVCISWIFFRSETIIDAYKILIQIPYNFSFSSDTLGMMGMILFFVAPIFVYECWDERKNHCSFNERSLSSVMLFSNYCIFMIILFQAPTFQEFIYFQF